MFRLFISWRYLISRRTNAIGVVGIFLSVSALITILSIMTGFLEQSRASLRSSLSDIVVEPSQYLRPDGRQVPSQPGPILAAVREDPYAEAAAAHLVWFGLIGTPGKSAAELWASAQSGDRVGVKFVGVDVQDEFATTDFRTSLTHAGLEAAAVADPSQPFAPPPEYEPVGRPRASVVVGVQLFRTHGLERGDEIELMTSVHDPATGEWVPSNRKFVVAGTFRSGENEMDLQRIYVEREELADFLGGTRGYSEILVRLNDYDHQGEAARRALWERLDEAGLIFGSPHEVRTWEQLRPVLVGAINNQRGIMGILLSLVLVVAGFTIFAILSMLVSEKRRDIGILGAVGATPVGIMSVFLWISLWQSMVGGVLGALAGWWAARNIDGIERAISSLIGRQIFDRDAYLFDHIPSQVNPGGVALVVFGAFACALISAVLPALRAARVDPLEALRNE